MEQMRPSNDLWRSMAPAHAWPAESATARLDAMISAVDPGGTPGRSRHLRRPARPRPGRPAAARAAGRPGLAVDAAVWDDPARRLVGLRPGGPALALGLRAPARRVRGLGGHACRAWSTRPTSSRWNTDKRYLARAGGGRAPGRADGVGGAGRARGAARRRPASGWSSRRSAPAATTPAGTPGRPGAPGPGRRPRRAGSPRPAGWRWCSRTCGAVDTVGETALLFLAGPSTQPRDPQGPDAHRARTRPDGLYKRGAITARSPPPPSGRWPTRAGGRARRRPSGSSTPGST